MKDVEPRLFQKEMFEKMVKVPKDTLLLVPPYRNYFYGIDRAKEGGDMTVVAGATRDSKTGKVYVWIDEYQSLPAWKWYRNPIKWWKWRRLWKSILKSSKNFMVDIDLDKSVKKDGRAQ